VVHIPCDAIIGSYDKFMEERKYDGALIAGINYKSPLYKELKNTKTPTVLLDNVIENDNIASISSESINAISEIVNMLAKLGHKKIGFIHADKSSFVTNKRFAGYIIGLTNNDIEYDSKYIFYGSYSEESGKEAAKYFINTDVTAIVCPSDTIAIGLMQELQNMGKKIPEDISITGYDDLEIARYVKPSLTTVRQNTELMAEKVFSLLSSMLMNRNPQSLTINSEIIKRDSIGEAKKTFED
jgi:LacI family transcriptional regulator